ncbi:hypothetical protein LUCX_276 [Xanthomonas phage vB_XciM_LucasX]|nr:hypothetical protein LUCX_276 [Xanthomonas phage vB_XciM_LucasX]
MPVPDPVLTPQQQLLDALNAQYKTHLDLSRVSFGVPVLVDPTVVDITDPAPPALPSRNSKVEITNAPGEPYEFATTLWFNRLSLTGLFESGSTTIAGDITHTYDLLPVLTTKFGFTVREEDIVGHQIEGGTYPLTVMLVADPASLLLFGQINLTLSGP